MAFLCSRFCPAFRDASCSKSSRICMENMSQHDIIQKILVFHIRVVMHLKYGTFSIYWVTLVTRYKLQITIFLKMIIPVSNTSPLTTT